MCLADECRLASPWFKSLGRSQWEVDPANDPQRLSIYQDRKVASRRMHLRMCERIVGILSNELASAGISFLIDELHSARFGR